MEELNAWKGMRCYGVYHFEKYPDQNILAIDFGIDIKHRTYVKGYAFTLDGQFKTGVELVLPMVGQEIGYIYNPNVAYSLELKFHNRL